MMLASNVYSPFKFLDSFKKDDFDIFFGRDKESVNLFELYRDTSLIILHGPSGSGKTSLIQCGLLNRLRINNDAIFSIRRNNNIVVSFTEKVFGIVNQDNPSLRQNDSNLVKGYLELVEGYHSNIGALDILDDRVIDLEEQVSKLRQEQYYYSKKVDLENTIGVQKEQQIVGNIEEKELEIEQILDQKQKLQKDFAERENQIEDALGSIKKYFEAMFKKAGGVPLVIFDQFEELFVYGSKDEIKKFGLVLKLIFDSNIPLNIVISLREEYFGHLDLFQSYIPNIFYKKIRLSHPNRETIKEIIYKSFDRFNINQVKDFTDINAGQTLSEEEKIKRIDLIIDKITITEDNMISYHLPFLQVYLDRLYKVDYRKTYGNGIPEMVRQTYGKYLPLEFNVSEIVEFGEIKNVLERYIQEINDELIENSENKLDNKSIHKNAVIKFLRHFKTKEGIKKRVPLRIEDHRYLITDIDLLNKIQQDIWGIVNETEYGGTISEMIEKLAENRILNVSSDHVELSHDIIARVISNRKIEEDFLALIRDNFNSSFGIYEKGKDANNLLTEQQLLRIYQYQQYVITDENADRLAQKNEFFLASRKKVDIKNRKEIREKEEQNEKLNAANLRLENVIKEKSRQYIKGKTYFNWAKAVSIIMLVTLISTLYFFYENKRNKEIIQGELDNQERQNKVINDQLTQLSKIKSESDSIKNVLSATIIKLENSLDSIESKKNPKNANSSNTSPENVIKPTTPEMIQVAYTKNIKTNRIIAQATNSRYLVAVYGPNVPMEDLKILEEKLSGAGYSLNTGSVLTYKPSLLATTSTVFYYSDNSISKANDLVKWLEKETQTKFNVQRGSGLGVIKGQENNTFFIHYINPY